jgi:hypothetical protein
MTGPGYLMEKKVPKQNAPGLPNYYEKKIIKALYHLFITIFLE